MVRTWLGWFWVFCQVWITQSQDLWETTIDFSVKDHEVYFSFEPANYSSYYMDLWFLSSSERKPCNGHFGEKVDTHKVSIHWPYVNASFENLGSSGFYCIRVTPVRVKDGGTCQDGCRSIPSDVFFLKGLGFSSCNKWNVVIALEPLPLKRSIVVRYSVTDGDGPCLKMFSVHLWFGVGKNCDGTLGTNYKTQLTFGRKNELRFENLEPGDFCVRVFPQGDRCECFPRHSDVKTLYPPVDPSPVVRDTMPSERWRLPTILAITLLGVTSLLLAAFYWKRKRSLRVRRELMLTERKMKMNNNTQFPIIPNEVVILSVHSSKSLIKRVRFLAEILRSCFGLSVCTAEEELHKISENPEGWMLEKLFHAKNKIVIIESPESVSHQKSWETGKQTYMDDGLLDLVFDNALAHVTAQKSHDYETVFVVRFADTPADCFLQMVVPCKRFIVPDHLPELCSHLVGTLGPHALDDSWQSQPSYVVLCNSLLKPVA